jgi:hypothetical protein
MGEITDIAKPTKGKTPLRIALKGAFTVLIVLAAILDYRNGNEPGVWQGLFDVLRAIVNFFVVVFNSVLQLIGVPTQLPYIPYQLG